MQPALQYPRTFGKYTLLRPLAAGGMAEVFLAQMKGPAGFDKACVVKRVLPSHAANKQYMEMFLDEARVIARLSHPNVVQVFDMGRVGDEYYMAMEYVPGADMQSLLDALPSDRRRMPIPVACRIIAQVAEGLEHAHRATDSDNRQLGIVHRDVSPSNVIVSTDGVAKICDFGIAKFEAQASKTEVGSLKGKIHYMSPEQVRGEKIDGRSDLFSLGALLYEATVGTRPFEGQNPAEIAIKILNDEVVPPDLYVERYPRELWAVLQRLLAKKPKDRFTTAREVQVALDELLMSWAVRATSNEVAAYLEQTMPGIGDRTRRAATAPAVNDRRAGDRRTNGGIAVEPTTMNPFSGSADVAFGSDTPFEMGAPLDLGVTDSGVPRPRPRDDRGGKGIYAILGIVVVVGAGFYYLTTKADTPAPAPVIAQPEAPKVDAPKPTVEAKTETPKPEAPKPETPKPEPTVEAKTETPKPEAPKPETPKTEPKVVEAPKVEPAKEESKARTQPKHHAASHEKSDDAPRELPHLPTPPPADDSDGN